MHQKKLLVIAVFLTFVIASTANADKPNIILVMADDQGWGDMGYNGHKVIQTPNFDKAAAAGLKFNRFYAAAPVCSPTRASVLTGRHPNRMGVFKWGYPIRPQETTLAEALKTVGYSTAHFGKWHLGSVRAASPANPGKNGFDEWLSAPNFYDNDPIMSHRGKAIQTKGESSMVAVDAAISWIQDKAENDDPFLAVVWFGSPHSPHRAVQKDREIYSNLPNNKQNFYGEITGMDRAFGKLRDSLGPLGIRDNTILWYCSDNGALPKVGSTGGFRGNKSKIYEGGLLVPAILEWPAKIKLPRSTNIRCNTSDIFPTLMKLADVQLARQVPLDGISLDSLITGQLKNRPQPMGFWDYNIKGINTPSAKWMSELLEAQESGEEPAPHPSSQNAAKLPSPRHKSLKGHAAWLDGDWKLHRIQASRGSKPRFELYDLANDPFEKGNLAGQEVERVKTMQKSLDDWMKSVVNSLNGDDYLHKIP